MEEPRTDDLIATPSSPYAAVKWACSTYARMFQELWDLPITILRIAMVYGPGQRNLTKLVPYVISSLHRQRAPQPTDGTRNIDWISIRATVHLLTSLVGSSVHPEFGALAQRQQDTSRISDPAAARELLGWSASTELADGLATTVRWYRDHLPSVHTPRTAAAGAVARIVEGAAGDAVLARCSPGAAGGAGGGLFGGITQPDCGVGQVRIGEQGPNVAGVGRAAAHRDAAGRFVVSRTPTQPGTVVASTQFLSTE